MAGAVRGWIDLLRGSIQFLVIYIPLGIVLRILITINMAMGGHNAEIGGMLDLIMFIIVPVLFIISRLMYAFIVSTREEDTSQYRGL